MKMQTLRGPAVELHILVHAFHSLFDAEISIKHGIAVAISCFANEEVRAATAAITWIRIWEMHGDLQSKQ